MTTFELDWWDGEGYRDCIITTDEDIVELERRFLDEEREDGHHVEDLFIQPV